MHCRNHRVSYFFSKNKKTLTNIEKGDYQFRGRISTVLSSWNSPMYAFPSSQFQQIVNKRIYENTCISENPIESNVISTCRPPKTTTTN